MKSYLSHVVLFETPFLLRPQTFSETRLIGMRYSSFANGKYGVQPEHDTNYGAVLYAMEMKTSWKEFAHISRAAFILYTSMIALIMGDNASVTSSAMADPPR